MNRIILILVFNTFLLSCNAQEKAKLLSNTPVDLSLSPLYDKLTDQKGTERVFKENFKHLESLEISKIWYLSDGLKINGYTIRPKAKGIYPCIIFNRGGNRAFGKFKAAHMAFFLGELAEAGFIVVVSNYRGDGESEGRDEFGGKDVNDVLNLIEVLPELEGVDTSKIGMYGWSRGGMMTYIALSKTNKIKAAAVGGGVSDQFETINDRPGMESILQELIPNYDENKTQELEKRSAVFFANKLSKEVPILIVHGSSDWRVKPIQAYRIAEKLDYLRIPYRLKIYEGADHGISEFKPDLNQEIINWFTRFLVLDESIPNMEYHGK